MFGRTRDLEERVAELEQDVVFLKLALESKEPNFDRRKSAHTTKRKKAETKGIRGKTNGRK